LPTNGGDALTRVKPESVLKAGRNFPFDIQTALNKIEFSVVNPYLIVLAGLRPNL
jgi:hypothetical protein